MISTQCWEKRQSLLTWYNTVFGRGMLMILRLVIQRCYKCKPRKRGLRLRLEKWIKNKKLKYILVDIEYMAA